MIEGAGPAVFHEEQRFGRGWFWGIVLAVGGPLTAIFGLGMWRQLVRRISFGNNPMSDAGLVVLFLMTLAIVGGVAWLVVASRLITEVRGGALHLDYRPLHRVTIPIVTIRRAEVRTYRPIAEFGGWGIRYGFGAGWAWNVSGTRGVQLELESGRKLLVGSQRPEELKGALDRAR